MEERRTFVACWDRINQCHAVFDDEHDYIADLYLYDSDAAKIVCEALENYFAGDSDDE